mgnify:CR=1 FL=1
MCVSNQLKLAYTPVLFPASFIAAQNALQMAVIVSFSGKPFFAL